MPQSLILLKNLPDANYLHDLQKEHVLRASMSFLPGGCWEGAGLFDASPAYLPLSADTSTQADSTCPNPGDTLGCLLWELWEAVRKVSPTKPLDFNAFAFLELEPGAGKEFVAQVLEVGGPDDGTTEYVRTERGREYVAAAHLIGCGTYNMVVEVLAEDHDRLLEILHALTDLRIVRQHSIGRLRAGDTRGFGEDSHQAASR